MKIKLLKKVTETSGTKTFYWQPEKPINYLPGQFYYFTLPKLNYPDPRGSTRHFTISSSPTEGTIIALTTRIREESGYKKTLDELPIGSEIEGEGPSGTFIMNEKDAELSSGQAAQVFIAGGIGITPFRSFIKYNIDKNLKIPMYLIYSNSNSEFVFGEEFKKWTKEFDFIKVEFVDSSKSGHLDAKLINQLTPPRRQAGNPLINPTYWVVGPPSFVDAVEVALDKLRIPNENIRSEKFTGY